VDGLKNAKSLLDYQLNTLFCPSLNLFIPVIRCTQYRKKFGNQQYFLSDIILFNQEVRMTTKTLDAVFNNGVFRPIIPQDVSIDEGQKVRLSA